MEKWVAIGEISCARAISLNKLIHTVSDRNETCLFRDCDRASYGACDKQTRDAFQPSRLTGVRLWAVITLQTLW